MSIPTTFGLAEYLDVKAIERHSKQNRKFCTATYRALHRAHILFLLAPALAGTYYLGDFYHGTLIYNCTLAMWWSPAALWGICVLIQCRSPWRYLIIGPNAVFVSRLGFILHLVGTVVLISLSYSFGMKYANVFTIGLGMSTMSFLGILVVRFGIDYLYRQRDAIDKTLSGEMDFKEFVTYWSYE